VNGDRRLEGFAPRTMTLEASVVMPTWDRTPVLAQCLRTLAAQSCDSARYEVLAHAPAARPAAAGPAAEAREAAPGDEVGAIRKDAHGD
jgi:hypothetical protein